jgi:hypothetical protein
MTIRPLLAFLVRGVGNVIKAEAALFEKELGQKGLKNNFLNTLCRFHRLRASFDIKIFLFGFDLL